MLNAKVLVEQFLTQSAHMRYVKSMLTLVVDCCLSPFSWQEWIIFLNKAWNWSLLPITFSINLPSVFKRTISLNILGVLYDALLGLGIMDVDILKCNGQCPKSIHALVMFIMLLSHNIFLTISLRCLQDNLLGPEVK